MFVPVYLRTELARERAIDLDLVEREAAQIAERGIAGAEIVHRDADAELPACRRILQSAGIASEIVPAQQSPNRADLR